MALFSTKHLCVIYLQDSDLEEQHCGEIPEVLVIKNNSIKDLLTILYSYSQPTHCMIPLQ